MTELIPLTEFQPLELGEGPVWNSRRQELSVVDIFQHKIHRFRLEGSQFVTVNSIDVASDVGAALPLVDGGFVTCQRDEDCPCQRGWRLVYRVSPPSRRSDNAGERRKTRPRWRSVGGGHG